MNSMVGGGSGSPQAEPRVQGTREPVVREIGELTTVSGPAVPRLGFLGVGWIGLDRLKAIAASGVAEIVAVADSSVQAVSHASAAAPVALTATSYATLLESELDGVVIATPSAAHAAQAIAALERGMAVFCQKPLARTAEETRRVVDAARAADRLLAVDLSYRFTAAMSRVRDLVRRGDLGKVYAVDLVFHNAYGPDKPWFRDPELSGGGCVMDLGIHLVDLAMWTLDDYRARCATSHLYAEGKPLNPPLEVVEDFALATLELGDGVVARLSCSWHSHTGRDAVIQATFHGTRGGAALRNVNGSFYDFTAEHFTGTASEVICTPPDAWSGRAAVSWARRLARGHRFDPEIERMVDVATALDSIYER